MTSRNTPPLVAWVALAQLAAVSLSAAPPPVLGENTGAPMGPRPRLLLSLPDHANTPDGMTLDEKTGDLYLASPNFNDPRWPGVILRIDARNRHSIWFEMPAHPRTGRGCPMGMDIGPDDNLYVADNQYFNDKNRQSRLMRVLRRDGRPAGCEVAVEGFRLANAVLWIGDRVFVSDTFLDIPDRPGMSAVYRFDKAELGRGPVKLGPGLDDPHIVATFTTVPNHRNDLAGADGLARDRAGNLYSGNFGDGVIHRIRFDARGVPTVDVLIRDPRLSCADGMFGDLETGLLYVADSEKNAIHAFTPEGKWWTVWRNGDTDGSDGLLDQPCELLRRGDELVVACFDMPFPGLTNQKYDAAHTVHVLPLERARHGTKAGR